MLARIRERLSPRLIMLAAVGLVLVVVLLALLVASLGNGKARTTAPLALAPTNTATTSAVTASPVRPTATRIPTALPVNTATPHPLPIPKNNPPPPPPPTATPRPKPTATATTPPAPTATPCRGTSCPPITPTPTPPPTATPGPCQPGGQPYYLTPTATPSTNQVAAALTSAANAQGLPVNLVEAIAWQESGWQINVIACDGGTGLMQLQPGTVTWLNQLYGINDNPYTLTGNADLGTRYLNYYYTFYIGYLQQNFPQACGSKGCNWDTPWPGATDGANVRDIVISVYNEGAGTMSNYGIINWWYVDDVLTFMGDTPPPWQ
jgi:outer membrane biosynthesis protein TonB